MPQLTPTITLTLSALTVITQIAIVLLILAWIRKQDSWARWFISFTKRHALKLILLFSFTATAGSLYYSEIAGYNPCKLCWYQRIFMYPQVVLALMALRKKTSEIIDYLLAMSVIGGLIALDHYYLQVGGSSIIPCSTVGVSASCSQRFVMTFGYITIPMMALTAFGAMVVIAWNAKRS